VVEEKWGRNPNTKWEGYRADLETILKKTPSRFHTLDNLKMAQFTNDAAKVAFKANCPLKPKNISTRVT